MMNLYGKESPEVLLARARLMQYHFTDGETADGISYAEYLEQKAEADRLKGGEL